MAPSSNFDVDLENRADGEPDDDISSLKGSLRRHLFREKVSSLLGVAAITTRLTSRRTEENTNCGVEYVKAFLLSDTAQSDQKTYVVTILKSLGASILLVFSHQWHPGLTW
jgi:hypothetical protein